MSLGDEVREAARDLGGVDPDRVIGIVERMIPSFKSAEVREYLESKLEKIRGLPDGEKKAMCAGLRPYFDWYLSGP